MKKLVLILIAGASFATANAQVQFGVKAGANLSNITGNDQSGNSALIGLNAGVFAKVPISGAFSFAPEVLYSGKGAKNTQAGVEYTLRENYLDVPLLFKWQHVSGFNVVTGPQVGFLLSANIKAQGQSEDVKSSFKSTEFAWDFGVGYEIPKCPVGIEFRYNLGLSNIADNSSSSSSSATAHNSVFQLGLRYTLFGASKK